MAQSDHYFLRLIQNEQIFCRFVKAIWRRLILGVGIG